MTICLARANDERPVSHDAALTTCQGCGAHRLCRRYKGLPLCVGGPSKCFRRRRDIYALRRRKENG